MYIYIYVGIDGEGRCSYGDNTLWVCYFASCGDDYGDSGIVIIDCKVKIIMHENSFINQYILFTQIK